MLGFEIVEAPSEQALFLRAGGSDNHHDLGLFGIGAQAPPPTRGQQVGLYHLAWEQLDRAIRGAVRIAPDELDERWGELPRERAIIAYCT